MAVVVSRQRNHVHIACTCRDRARRVARLAAAHASFQSHFFNQWVVVGAARAQCTKDSPYIVIQCPALGHDNYKSCILRPAAVRACALKVIAWRMRSFEYMAYGVPFVSKVNFIEVYFKNALTKLSATFSYIIR